MQSASAYFPIGFDSVVVTDAIGVSYFAFVGAIGVVAISGVMDEGYGTLPSSYLLGSVPAVVSQDGKSPASGSSGPPPDLHTFPPGNAGGYQAPGSSYEGDNQATTSWRGVFSVSSYSPYFNVDTDVVFDRIMCSVSPYHGNFAGKIDANPDLYGPVWISTTLVFILAAFGNCATYLMKKKADPSVSWNFDVSYVNWAACVVYAYLAIVPAAFYFLLQYFGSNASIIRLWCMWGYSLFIFLPTSLLLVIPVALLRWIIILIAGASSASFIAMNFKAYLMGDDLMVVVVSAFLLQFALAIFIKVFFFA